MDYVTRKQLAEIKIVRRKIYDLSTQHQLEEIQRLSPYSANITQHIKQYNELRLYYSLHLQESNLTRPCLIRDIDFNLWISSEGCTNLELMQKGNAPYLFDEPEGKIELHHVAQEYSAPFVELTLDEHDENSKLLHPSREPSWRKDKKLENAFYTERSEYWKRRAIQDYVVSNYQFEQFPPYHFKRQTEYREEIRKTCEVLYGQCDAEDLDYLSDLAKSFAMMQRVGATTLSEFLKSAREERQAPITCVVCGSTDYVLYGTYQTERETVQRYKCQRCGKVFSPLHKSLVSGSSFSFREWIKFIDCVYNGYTNKQIAKACDISEHTAHENRTKLFYALKLLNDKVQLKGNVVLDETYLPVSYKGNHSKQEDFVMPREANERGGENHTKGISDNLVCIICALDDSGNSVAKVAGIGASTTGKLKYVLQGHLSDEVFCLYSDKSRVIKSFAKSCGLEIKQGELLKKGTKRAEGVPLIKDTYIINRYLQTINSYHSRLKRFLNRFSGISTKYLSGYLYLFAWKERSKDREPEGAYRELLQIMTEPNHYLSVADIMKDGYIPDARNINQTYRKQISQNLERDKEIYRRYAAGETMTAIAKDYGVTRQSISLIIQNLRENGIAYKTQWDIQKELSAAKPPKSPMRQSARDNLERDYKIYAARMQWTGKSSEFNSKIAIEYNMSVYNVKNIICRIKRIERLKEEIFIYEDIPFRSLKEVYQDVYADYLRLREQMPEKSQAAYAQQLAGEYKFTPNNILRIIQIMNDDNAVNYLSKKRKLSTIETYNRDRSIFIEYLRWAGDRKSFKEYAAHKFNISTDMVNIILRFCLYADPKRFEIV